MIKTSSIFTFFSLLLLVLQLGCSNSRIVNEAIKKHGAATYYFEQGDYVKARKYYLEARELWVSMKASKNKSIPEWSLENHIDSCDSMLELLPASKPLAAPVVVPLLISNKSIFVEVVLNNKEKIMMLLDTGATSSIISPKIAKSLFINPQPDSKKYKLRLVGEKTIDVPFVYLSEMKIDKAVVENLHVGVYEAFPFETFIDGLLGTDFLQHFTMMIDHNTDRLTLIQKRIREKEGRDKLTD